MLVVGSLNLRNLCCGIEKKAIPDEGSLLPGDGLFF